MELNYKKARQGLPEARALVLDFVELVYHQTQLPLAIFANQIGVEPQTVRLWLGRRGNLPGPRAFSRLVKLYRRAENGTSHN